MEVSVLAAENPPAMPVLAIHTGSVRRQAKLEVNEPFVMPHPGSQNCAVEVALFQQLASQLLPDDGAPEATCNIPVRRPDGDLSQVQLRVRRSPRAEKSASPTAEVAAPIGAVKTPLAAKDYLDHHCLQKRIQQLIQDVLREQPENPYRYMLEQLRSSRLPQQPPAEPASAPEPPKAQKEDVASESFSESFVAKAQKEDVASESFVAKAPPPQGPPPEAPQPAPAPREVAPPPAASERAPAAPERAPAEAAPMQPSPPAQPRAPEKAAPPRSGRRPVPPVSPSADAKPSEAAAKGDSHRLSQAVVAGVLHSPRCLKVAEESVRDVARKDTSRHLVSSILGHVLEQAANSPTEQAHAVMSQVYKGAAWRLSETYRHDLTQRTIRSVYRGSLRIANPKCLSQA